MTNKEIKQLKRGDLINIEFRDGTLKRKFYSFVNGLVFYHPKSIEGKECKSVNYTYPENVRDSC